MADMTKYLDLKGLIHYDEELKDYIEQLLEAHSKTLTIGKYTYNGTADVNVEIYNGNYE